MDQDKHVWIAETTVSETARPRRKNVTPVVYQHNVTRKTRITLVMMGCWGVYFAPYNIARLSALTKEAGYATRSFDFNVDLYTNFKPIGLDKAWDSMNFYWWNDGQYQQRIHDAALPYYEKYLEQIVQSNPTIVGFSIFNTNLMATNWMVREVKKRIPGITVIVGGPTCHDPEFTPIDEIDYFVAGEGEQVFLDFLDKFEQGILPEQRKVGEQYSDNRVDIDSLPFPDYSEFDLSLYTNGTGVSAEISRGCVAKCSFCTETWFWKFRDRQADRILNEVEYQIKNYGINYVWFIDSLVNGNLKELRKFALGVIEKNFNIQWMGYVRCDGRMDADYFIDLKKSGAHYLSFGVESGSQKVLDLMQKKVQVSEIDNNMRDCKAAGITVHVNWIVGFPNEDIDANNQSLVLLWNNRNYMDLISTGMTLGDHRRTDFEYNRDRYNMSDWGDNYWGWWYTKDHSNTKLHRLVRMKLLNIWLDICHNNGCIINTQRREIDSHYTISKVKLINPPDRLEYDNFDHNVIKTDLGNFADTAMNEIWAFLRVMYRAAGGFDFKLRFDYDEDIVAFGDTFMLDRYDATYDFSINDAGEWTADFNFALKDNDPWRMHGDKSFAYHYIGNGSWTEVETTQPNKVIWIQS